MPRRLTVAAPAAIAAILVSDTLGVGHAQDLLCDLCGNGLALAGVEVLYQTFAVGVLIIVAVSVDQWIRRVRK